MLSENKLQLEFTFNEDGIKDYKIWCNFEKFISSFIVGVVMYEELNEDQIDYLKELINISYASATAAITEILDEFATLQIPEIKILPISDINPFLKSICNKHIQQYISSQLISGDILGESLFIIDEVSTINLIKNLQDYCVDEADIEDIVLEINNILTSQTLSNISDEFEFEILFEPPIVDKINSIECFDSSNLIEIYEQIIVISTELVFEKEKIKGNFLILTKNESMKKIKEKINKILQEL